MVRIVAKLQVRAQEIGLCHLMLLGESPGLISIGTGGRTLITFGRSGMSRTFWSCATTVVTPERIISSVYVSSGDAPAFAKSDSQAELAMGGAGLEPATSGFDAGRAQT